MKKILIILFVIMAMFSQAQVNKQILQVADTSKVFGSNKQIGDFIDIKTYPKYLFKLKHTTTAMQTVGYALRSGWCDTINGTNYWNKVGNKIYTSTNDSVGIGKIPTAKLDVNGDALINGITVGAKNSYHNTVVGLRGLRNNSTGQDNTAIGFQTLYTNTIGNHNTAIGYGSLFYNLSGLSNTAIGYGSLFYNSTGSNNTAIGDNSLYFNLGKHNTAIGKNTLTQNTTGYSNVGIGVYALYSNTTSSNLVAIGDSALYSNTIGLTNTAIGSKALRSVVDGNGNTAIGWQALMTTTYGSNTAVGAGTLRSTTMGYSNTGLGYNSLINNITGNSNTALGTYSLLRNSTGVSNIAVGLSAGDGNGAGYTNLSYRMYLGSRDSTDVGIYFDRTSTTKWGRWNGNLKITGKYTQGEVAKVTIDTISAIRLLGNATVWDDVKFDALTLNQSGPGVSVNLVESTVDYLTTANQADYLIASPQFPHAMKAGSVIYPHIHFTQAQAGIPNWALQYRWQKNLGTKTTAWTAIKCNLPAIVYTAGSINQIAYTTAGITPPVGYSISDIVQFRIIRDTANGLGLAYGADPYGAVVSVLSFDIHIEIDSMGSNDEYVK